MAAPQTPMRQLNIKVSEKVVAKLDAMAKTAGTSTTSLAGYLFDAAYAARVNGTPDADLDAHVSLVGLATLGGADLDRIVTGTGLDPKVVKRMQKAWWTVLDDRRRGA